MDPPIVSGVYRAIQAVRAEVIRVGVGKTRRNQQQGYPYRGIDDFLQALAGPLDANHLLILPRMVERTQQERATARGGTLFYTTVKAEFDFISEEDGTMHTVATYGEAMDTADKATNKAMSAAWKYAAILTFNIPLEGVPDADDTTPPPSEPTDPLMDAVNDAIRCHLEGDNISAYEALDEFKGNADKKRIWTLLGDYTELQAAIKSLADADRQPPSRGTS